MKPLKQFVKALSSASIALLICLIAFPAESIRSSVPSAYVYPVMAPRLSSDFGTRTHPVLRVRRHHEGVDLAAPSGAQVRAIADGVVVFADPYKGYGNLVVIKHSDALTSHYGHLQKILVAPGQKISPGAVLGLVGTTGRVTGPHLHFEIRLHGKSQDPEKFIPGLALQAEG